MLLLEIPAGEFYDNAKNEFIYTKATTLKLEHSLLSVSKWEEKWKIPYIGKGPQTREQSNDYVRCMCIQPNVDPFIFKYCLTPSLMQKVNEYIDDPHTATTITNHSNKPKRGPRKPVSSEEIYAWMVEAGIWKDAEKWHLNRLLTLIEVCSIRNSPDKKMGKNATLRQNAELNAARRKALHSRG